MDLNYLMTSDFNEGLTPEQLTELLIKFRYEYRFLSGKNSSYEKELDKLSLINDNLNKLIKEIETKSNIKIAILEDELFLVKNKLNKKLTWKERFFGKINRKDEK